LSVEEATEAFVLAVERGDGAEAALLRGEGDSGAWPTHPVEWLLQTKCELPSPRLQGWHVTRGARV
jgi:hypothetical protein